MSCNKVKPRVTDLGQVLKPIVDKTGTVSNVAFRSVSAELLKLAIMMTIPTRIDNTDWVTKIFVKFEGEETKSPDIFGGYT
jgi:hypothetical protein